MHCKHNNSSSGGGGGGSKGQALAQPSRIAAQCAAREHGAIHTHVSVIHEVARRHFFASERFFAIAGGVEHAVLGGGAPREEGRREVIAAAREDRLSANWHSLAALVRVGLAGEKIALLGRGSHTACHFARVLVHRAIGAVGGVAGAADWAAHFPQLLAHVAKDCFARVSIDALARAVCGVEIDTAPVTTERFPLRTRSKVVKFAVCLLPTVTVILHG